MASKSASTDPAERLRAYLRSLPADGRRALEQLRRAIRTVAPDATEGFAYGIPAYRVDGRVLIYCAAWKQHTSLYPLTAAMRRVAGREIDRYETSKGTVKFPLDMPIPLSLVKRLVKARLAEVRPAGERAAGSRLNRQWHDRHPMPKRPTLDERVVWHAAHARHCSCRAMPDIIRRELTRRGIEVPMRR
jgi:uncharacterized protein YdhG (YjbR/CyaY superfamily)